MPQNTTTEQPILSGLLNMCFGVFILPIMDAFAKNLGTEMSAGQVAWWRFTAQCTLLAPLLFFMRSRLLKNWHFEPRTVALQMLPGVFIAIATTLFFQGLQYMSMAKTLTIFFIYPLLLVALSALILRETLRLRRISALLAGFAGAMIVVRPTSIDFEFAALLPMGTALFFALYFLTLRYIAKCTHPLMTQMLVGTGAWIFLSLALLITATTNISLPIFTLSAPETHHLLPIIGIGIVAITGHTMLVSAAARIPASLIAPLSYIELLSATAIGYLIFNEVPDQYTIIGAIIIIASGIYIVYREHQLSKKPKIKHEIKP